MAWNGVVRAGMEWDGLGGDEWSGVAWVWRYVCGREQSELEWSKGEWRGIDGSGMVERSRAERSGEKGSGREPKGAEWYGNGVERSGLKWIGVECRRGNEEASGGSGEEGPTAAYGDIATGPGGDHPLPKGAGAAGCGGAGRSDRGSDRGLPAAGGDQRCDEAGSQPLPVRGAIPEPAAAGGGTAAPLRAPEHPLDAAQEHESRSASPDMVPDEDRGGGPNDLSDWPTRTRHVDGPGKNGLDKSDELDMARKNDTEQGNEQGLDKSSALGSPPLLGAWTGQKTGQVELGSLELGEL
eukprot:gene23027-biopygen7249